MINDLAPVQTVFERLGGLSIPAIHIAGSKGKGTTAVLLAKILEAQDLKIGLFTSPFLFRAEEMIQVNGRSIPPARLTALMERIQELEDSSDAGLTEFELQTLAAFEYFKEQTCDYIVVECGLGGKTDATNVLENKALTILTHVELEHTEFLGATLGEIARNKLGIARPGVPLLTGTQPPEVMKVFGEEGITPVFVVSMELGRHHPESVGLAVAAADFLGYSLDSILKETLAQLTLPGRFEVLSFGTHTLILDGAHTYDSIEHFLRQVNAFQQEHKLPDPEFAIHILKDKRSDLWTLFPRHRTVWVPLADPRAGTPPSELSVCSSDALFTQLLKERGHRFVVFCGSFRLVAAAQESIQSALREHGDTQL